MRRIGGLDSATDTHRLTQVKLADAGVRTLRVADVLASEQAGRADEGIAVGAVRGRLPDLSVPKKR